MPLNQAQKDAIAKINGGADILAIIDADETEHLTFADTNKDLTAKLKETETKNRALTKEQVARKRAMQNVQETAKAHGLELFGGEFGLEPPTPLEEQFAAVLTKSDTVTKDTVVKNPEYLKLSKELEQMKKEREAEKIEAAKEKEAKKTAERRAALQPLVMENFGDMAPYVLDAILSKQISVNEAGEDCIKDGDTFIPLTDTANVTTTLKKLHPKAVQIKVKPGSGNTPAKGGTQQPHDGKLTYKEWGALEPGAQAEYMKKYMDAKDMAPFAPAQ